VVNKDNWEQYQKYIRALPDNGLKNLQKKIEYQVENEERKLRKQQLFEQREKELDFINEVILGRKNEAK
jgi:hypothetical protein